MKTLNLTEEQRKTLKLFAYYCGSYGAKEATLTCYLTEDGAIDWIDSNWYSDTMTIIEGYDKINLLIEDILENSDLLDYYDFNGPGSLQIELDVLEKKLSFTGYHTEWETTNHTLTWENFHDAQPEFDSLFESLSGQMNGVLYFEGSGDSGWIEDEIITDNGKMDCPEFFKDWCYEMLGNNFGGWEINEGSQGEFNILPNEKMVELNFNQNFEDNVSDGIVGYAEF